GIVDTDRQDRAHRSGEILRFGRVERMRRAEFASKFAAPLVRLEYDDRLAALHDRAHDSGKTDGAAAENEDGRALLAGERIHDTARARLDTTTQGAGQFERKAFWHLHNIALIGDAMSREGGLAEEMARDVFTCSMQRLSAVRTHACIVQHGHGVAISG